MTSPLLILFLHQHCAFNCPFHSSVYYKENAVRDCTELSPVQMKSSYLRCVSLVITEVVMIELSLRFTSESMGQIDRLSS